MLTTMTVRCNQCGHENNPEYRFCGMCGAPLPLPTAPEPQRTRVSAVGGPSFLGLGDDRSSDLDYLLDDEPAHGHGRLYLALLLLALSAGLLAWHWQREGNPWAALTRSLTKSQAPAVSPAAPELTASASSPATATVTPPATEPPPANSTATGTGAQPVAGTSPVEDVVPNSAAATKPPEQNAEAANDSDSARQDASANSATAPPQDSRANNNGSGVAGSGATGGGTTKDTAAPDAAGASGEKESQAAPVLPTQKPAASRPAATRPAPAVPPVSPEDRLVDEGERYLYGHGVRPDCNLAQRNLMIGARQSNTKAQTLLGAMYATGHCVGRDLPTAYRWFAKALHGDPSNSRVQRDLEVLWKQMTPEERLLAMKNQ